MSRHDPWGIVRHGRLNTFHRSNRCLYGGFFLLRFGRMEERKPVRLGEGLFRQAGRCRTPRGVYYLSRDWSGRRAGDYFHQNKWAEAQKAESRKPYGARHDLNPRLILGKVALKGGKKQAK
jgi:hypothetical protein